MGTLMGIDLGSTSIKALIYAYDGSLVGKGSSPTPLSYNDPKHPSWCVWEPQKLWENTAAAIKQAVSGIADASDIKGVAVTGFGMDGLPLDKDGKELYPLISWHCPRTEPQASRFSDLIGKREIFRKSGKQVMNIDSIYRMMWLSQHHPEIMDKADVWLLVEDFINNKLCGSKVIDYSMACTTSVFNPEKREWVDDLIEAAGVPRHIFPKPVQSGTVIGEITAEASFLTGLKKGTPVVMGGHDYICAGLAVGNIFANTVMNVTGTWEMLVKPSSRVRMDDAVFGSGYYIESHAAKGLSCYVGGAVCGDMLEWFKEQYAYEELAAEKEKGINAWKFLMDKAASSKPSANGCFFLPHFSGAYAPKIDRRSLGAFIGLSNVVSKGDMVRAMIEGLDYQLRDMLEALESALSETSSKIICVGGATNNAFWMQNKADVLGKEIAVPDIEEATSLGAALLAGIGTGMYKDEVDAVKSTYKEGIFYQPDMALHEQYTDHFQSVYLKMQGSLIGLNADIFKKFKA